MLCHFNEFDFNRTDNPLIITDNINLPTDSIIKNQLLASLNGFLEQKEKPNKENTFVLNADLLETSILLDEIKGIERNRKLNDNNFYKAYLTNAAPLNDNNFLVQLSYIGLKESLSSLRASFTLIAVK